MLQVAALVVSALIIYSPVLRGGWLWDDGTELTQNSEVTSGRLADIWFAPSHMDYFPLKTTVQWVSWRLWGDRVVGYHLLNVGLHLLSGLLVWRLFARIGLRSAWLGGLLFVVHPVAVESVAWIAELKNTLALPPLLLSAIAYIDFTTTGRRGRYIAALAWFVVSMLCKTSGVMLPVVFALYHLWRAGRLARRDLAALFPFFVTALGFGLLTIYFQHSRAIGDTAVPIGGMSSRAAVAGMALWFYLGKIALPLGLVPVYRAWDVSAPSFWHALPWVATAAVVFVCWRRRASWGGHVLFGLAAFGALVAPVLGFVSMSYMRYSWVADHFVYLPMIPLLALVVAGGDALQRRAALRHALRVGIGAALVGLVLLGRSHARVFRDEPTLWTRTLQLNPQAWPAYDGLGRMHLAEGRAAEAEAHFNRAIALAPRALTPGNNLATLRLRQGRAAEAVPILQGVLAIDPKFVAAKTNLGNAYLQLGRPDDAMREYRGALELSPALVEARNNLANALFLAGKPEEAIAELRRALALRPDYVEGHQNLGKLLLRAGRNAEAVTAFEAAARLAPRDPVVQNDLGYALLISGDVAAAAIRFGEAVRLKPDYVDALTNLAGARYRLGDVRAAIAHYEAALRIDPQASDARQNLEMIRGEQRRDAAR